MTFSSPQDNARPAASDAKSDAADNKAQNTSTHQWQAEFQALNQTGAKVRQETTGKIGDTTSHTTPAGNSNEAPTFNHDGFASSLIENAAYQGQQAIKGLAQIVDLSGTKTADHLNYFAKPKAAEYKSAEWYGEQLGGAVGKFAPFVAAFAVTRGASAKLGITTALEGAGEGALLSRNSAILTGQSAIAGFASEAIFTPNEGKPTTFGQFASERMKNGTVGAIDMAALTAGSLSIKALATSAVKEAPLGSAILRNSAVSSAVAGIPTGMIGAEAHARIFEGRGSTAAEREQSALSMAVVGFGLGAVHEGMTSKTRSQAPGIADALNDKINAGLTHVDNFAASINPFLANSNRLAFAYAEAGSARPLRSMAMQSTMRDLNSQIMFRDTDGGDASQKSGGTSRGSSRQARGAKSADDGVRERVKETAPGVDEATPRISLKQALSDMHLSEIADFVSKNKTFKDQVVVRSLGDGNDSMAVLELAPSKAFPEGGALKVTIPEGGWQREWGSRSFDAQLLSKVHEVDLAGSDNSGTANVYVQELLDVQARYPQDLVDDFFAKLQQSGLEFGDPGADPMKQVGVSRKTGELKLLDYPSVDKSGAHETLQAIIQGHEGVEAEYERENQNIKGGHHDPAEAEKADFETFIDVDREARAQDALKGGRFTETEQSLLEQLTGGGISRKEVIEMAALEDGKFAANGMPDMKYGTNKVAALEKRARAAGILEAGGKKGKGRDVDDYSSADDNY